MKSILRKTFISITIIFFSCLEIYAKPVTLTFNSLAWIAEEQKVQKEVVNEWNKNNPDIQVQVVKKSWRSAKEELLTAFDTGDVPDIFHYSQPIIADWKNLGFLTDLSPMISKSDFADVNDDIWSGLRAKNGDIVGIPIQYEVDVTYYNTKIFKKNNIKPPTMDDPWTFDEMIKIARKLHGSEGADFKGMGFPGPDHFGRVFSEIWAPKIGDKLVYKKNNGDLYVKLSEESISFIKKIKSLIDEGLIGKEMLIRGGSKFAMQDFVNGKSAMIVGYGCWVRSRLLKESEGINAIEWAVAAPIKVNNTNIYGYIQTLSVPSEGKNKEAAFKFLKWYWGYDNVLKIAKSAFIMPGRNSAIMDASLKTPDYSWDLVQKAVQRNVLPEYVKLGGWGQFSEGFANRLFAEYWVGEITIQDFIKKYEYEGTRLLQDFNE